MMLMLIDFGKVLLVIALLIFVAFAIWNRLDKK